MDYSTRKERFTAYIKDIECLKNSMEGLVFWDQITNMPEGGAKGKSRLLSILSSNLYNMVEDSQYQELISFFSGNSKNDILMDKTIRKITEDNLYIRKIPADEYRAYAQLMWDASSAWIKAREENSYSIMEPYMKQLISYWKKFAGYWQQNVLPYESHMHFYDKLLSARLMDDFSSTLTEPLIEILKRSESSDEAEAIKLDTVDDATQLKIWRVILRNIGFDFKRGRVDIGEFPTILVNSSDDVRIISSKKENDIFHGIFNVLHGGGKGLYQQNISKDLEGTFLACVTSFTFEEAIGKFYENIVGKNPAFWRKIYPEIVALVPELERYTPEKIAEAVNRIRPGAQRIETDEVSYMLCTLLRYEIERNMIEGSVKPEELPERWNRLTEKYLGYYPENLRDGLLQDIHWVSGYFGYFPSYILANIISVQLKNSISTEIGPIEELLCDKDGFRKINEWFTENIFKYGSFFSEAELADRLFDGILNAKTYLDYLQDKYL